MNKKITLATLFVAFTFLASAQISFDKDSLKVPNANSQDFDHSEKSYLTNNNSDPADTVFSWAVSNVTKPAEWELTICSGEQCISDPTAGEDNTFNLGIGKKMLFKIGFSFEETFGDGGVLLVAKSTKNPSTTDSLIMTLHARGASVDLVSKTKFSAYPNPATDFITIKLVNGGTEVIKIYDILGNLHISQKVYSGDKIDVRNLAKGVYIVRIEGNQSFSKVLQKQ